MPLQQNSYQNSLQYFRELVSCSSINLLELLNNCNISPIHSKIVGDRIKELRTKAGYSLTEMAKKIEDADPNCVLPTKFSKHTLHRLEHGKRKLSLIEAVVISNVLGISILDFIPQSLMQLAKNCENNANRDWEVVYETDKIKHLVHIDTKEKIFVFNETNLPLPRLLFILANLVPYRTLDFDD